MLSPCEIRVLAETGPHVTLTTSGISSNWQAGLDEDWTDDALTPEEEVAEDKELLSQIDDAAASILAAKGVPLHLIHSQRQHGADAEARAVRIASSDVVLGLLADGANAGSGGAGGGTQTADGEPLDLWTETEAHEVRIALAKVYLSRYVRSRGRMRL